MLRRSKGKPWTVNLVGDFLGFKLFIIPNHEQIKLCLLTVTQKKVLANYRRIQNRINLPAGFHGLCRFMVHPLVGNPQRIQQIIGPDFFFQTPGTVSGSSQFQFHCLSLSKCTYNKSSVSPSSAAATSLSFT